VKRQQKKEGLLAWVWRDHRPGMIRVRVMEDQAGSMQMAKTEKQYHRLRGFAWKVRFTFYLYPQEDNQ